VIPTASSPVKIRDCFPHAKHGKVEVEIEMTNSFGDKPMDVTTPSRKIRGSERPARW